MRVLLEGAMDEEEWTAVDGHKLAKILFYEFGQRLVKVKVFFFFDVERAQKKILIAPETLRINQWGLNKSRFRSLSGDIA